MEPILIHPHHLTHIHMAYKGRPIGEGIYYYNDAMRDTDIENIHKIMQNPAQQVRIVSGIDSLCAVCPNNKYRNSDTSHNDYCELESEKMRNTPEIYTYIYGVQNLVDKQPISSKQLIDTMKANYSSLKHFYLILKSAIKL